MYESNQPKKVNNRINSYSDTVEENFEHLKHFKGESISSVGQDTLILSGKKGVGFLKRRKL